MLGQGQLKLKVILIIAGFVAMVVWVAALVASFVAFFLGFPIPEILISPEATISASGYCWLINEFYVTRRRGERHYWLLTILGLTVGITLIITGYNTIANLNIFTYLCLIIGTALIFINTKQIWYALRRL
jgi:hypothetical protein